MLATAKYRAVVLPVLAVAAILLLILAALLLGYGPAGAQSGAPTVTAVAITSDAGDDDTYLLGDAIRITLTFSEAVNVTGAPSLKIDMDPADWGEKQAGYDSGSGSATLTFTHTVVEPNLSTQGIAVLSDSLALNGGSIQSASSDTDAELSHAGLAHDAQHKVNWQAGADDGALLPAPVKLRVATEPGSFDVALDWDDVDGATRYWMRWRSVDNGEKLNAGVEVESSLGDIAVTGYGEWVARVQACNDAGCGKPNSRKFTVEPTPEPTPTAAPESNRPPAVNEQTAQYAAFVGTTDALRGESATKSFSDIFTDQDGDDLTYSVSVSEEHRNLLDELYITLDEDVRAAGNTSQSVGAHDLVFIRPDAEDDWDAVRPLLPEYPFPVTVTLTATDSSGLSASVEGDFRVIWEPDFMRRAPGGLAYERVSSSQLRLSWNGHESVTYEVQSRHLEPDSGMQISWTKQLVTEAGASSAVISGMSCDTEYDFRLRAVDRDSAGPFATLEGVGTYVEGSSDSDTWTGGSDSECYRGGEGADTIAGGDGDDVIRGGGGDDVIYGNNAPRPTPTPAPVQSNAAWRGMSGAPAWSSTGWYVSPRARLNPWTGQPIAIPVALVKPVRIPAVTHVHEQVAPNLPTLISNLGQTSRASSAGLDFAQSFTTGSNAGGYTLTGVTLKLLSRTTALPTYQVRIQENSGASPGALLGTLTNPSSLPIDTTDLPSNTPGLSSSALEELRNAKIAERLADVQFTAAGNGISLAANTRYWVVFEVSDHNDAEWYAGVTVSDYEDFSSGQGGTIVDNSLDRGHSHSSGNWNSRTYARQLAIHGSTQGTSEDDEIYGAFGNDLIYGQNGNDMIYGGPDDDVIEGGDGNDTMWGGSGDDIIGKAGAEPGDDNLWGGLGADTLYAGAGNDILYGDQRDDYVGSADTLYGGPGDDFLDGGAGADDIIGDESKDGGTAPPLADYDDPAKNYYNWPPYWAYPGDTVSYYAAYAWAPAGVTVDLNPASGSVTYGTGSGGHAEGDRFWGIENIVGTLHDDSLKGNNGPNLLRGGEGADILHGGDSINPYNAADYRDSKCGVAITLRFVIDPNDPNDVEGTGQDNRQNCGSEFVSAARGDRLYNIYAIHGSHLDDVITGLNHSQRRNRLFGGLGNDTLNIGNGDHYLNGGPGVDTVSYSMLEADIPVTVNLRTDTAVLAPIETGATRTHTLKRIQNATGGSGNDNITGSSFENSILRGGPGNDTLHGLGGNNRLYGDAGDDTSHGYHGSDQMDGGPGTDTVSYSPSRFTLLSNLGQTTAASASDLDFASRFNVDSGYTLTGVTLKLLLTTTAAPTYEVRIQQLAPNGWPGEVLGTLTNPQSLPTDTTAGLTTDEIAERLVDVEFAAPGDGIQLSSGAWYWLVFDVSSANNATWHAAVTTSNAEDSGGEQWWSISDFSGYRNSNSPYWKVGSDVRQIAIDGYRTVPAGVNVNLRTGESGDSEGFAHGDTYANIENVIGSRSDDTITGSAAANALDGGAGTDTVSYEDAPAGVTLDLGTSSNNTGDARGDTFSNVEKFVGSTHADTMIGDGNANDLSGGDGADKIRGGGGADKLDGGAGEDKLAPGGADDTVAGGTGTDEFYFYWAFGNDTISDYSAGEKIFICNGTEGTGAGQVDWSQAASGSDWIITVRFRDSSGNVNDTSALTLTGISANADVEWSNPDAAPGTGCKF